LKNPLFALCRLARGGKSSNKAMVPTKLPHVLVANHAY